MSGYFTPPALSWSRKLNEPDPEPSVHTFSRPAILDALSLLPLAYRMGQYISTERKNNREPIFDLSGITLEPPKPGPYGGVPCGGIGGGSITRGFRGDFRRWSLWPGKYVHRVVYADQFSLRIKRLSTNTVYATVLSAVAPSQEHDLSCCTRFWNWNMDPSCGTYYAVFPRAWTVYENPLPGVKVIIRQVSPFIPSNYSDSSLPACLFHVEVINTGDDEIEASVMFSFQNGDGGDADASGGFVHCPHSFPAEAPSTDTIYGILMAHHRETSKTRRLDQGSFSIACQTSSVVSFCKQFICEKPKSEVNTDNNHIVSENENQTVFTSLFSTIKSVIDQNMFGSEYDVYSGSEEADILWACFRDTGHAPMFFSSSNDEATETASNPIDDEEDPLSPSSPSLKGYKVASALCVSFGVLSPGTSSNVTFSLAWDHPVASFGSSDKTNLSVPRYYSRFFGTTGLQAFHIAAFALLQSETWEDQIITWQDSVITALENSDSFKELDGAADYYQYHLFNELYYLVDSGTVWANSANGQQNPIDEVFKSFIKSWSYDEKLAVNAADNSQDNTDSLDYQVFDVYKKDSTDTNEMLEAKKSISRVSSDDSEGKSQLLGLEVEVGVESPASDERIYLSLQSVSATILLGMSSYMQQHNQVLQYCVGRQNIAGQFLYYEGHEYLMYNTYDVHFYSSFALLQLFPQLELSIQRDFAAAVVLDDPTERVMIGEGHKAPRKVKSVVPHDLGSPSGTPWKDTNAYNFQDVSNWKDLGPKFILQVFRDYKYITTRLYPDHMLSQTEKQSGIRQSRASSNSELSKSYDDYDDDSNTPRERHSSDDVYADYLKQEGKKSSLHGNASENAVKSAALDFLKEMYPICEMIMTYCLKFDVNHDGMIENSGFPDQTYDIWIASDVHAYCGGLWVAACIAMSEITELIVNYNKHLIIGDNYDYYHILASKASYVYITKLWNGKYFNYDSSNSDHHDSIMADMLAGQWYAHACGLSALVISSDMAFSCLETIFQNNVIKFGQGELIGAVNGMRPTNQLKAKINNAYDEPFITETNESMSSAVPATTPALGNIWNLWQPLAADPSPQSKNPSKQGNNLNNNNDVDCSCLQSKEVWTGTTYALSACMIHEANYLQKELTKLLAHQSIDDKRLEDMKNKISKLRYMAYTTAKGIHDGGWQKFGYWFATPEAWEYNGNYRSLGYMRPLAIWAMQLANSTNEN